MKKKTLATLSILLFTATVLPFVAKTLDVKTVEAQRLEAEASAQTDELLVPQTYEQYLPLTAPVDVAVSEHYTAIADKNCIYVYDRADNEYRTFSHGTNDAPESNVSKLQFDEYGTLYFLDSSVSTNFYTLNVETGAETKLDLACGTFTVHGSDLYFTNAQEDLYAVSLSEASFKPVSLQWSGVSSLSFWNGELYFIRADYYLMKIDPKSQTSPDATKATFATFSSQMKHIAIGDGILACTNASGNLFTYALSQAPNNETLFQSERNGFTALCAFGKSFYAVHEQTASIREYSTETNGFTDFEISASSDAPNRLSGATDVFMAGDKLFISDVGNARVSVFNRKTNGFETPVPCSFAPTFVSADATTLLIANAEKAVLYSLSSETYGEPIAQFSTFNGKLIGTASVYGTYYLASENNYAYALAQNENGEWNITETKKTSTRYPKALTSDVYGYLYILSGDKVYRFDEAQFCATSEIGEEICKDLPSATTKIAVDYGGKVYALASNALYRQDGTIFDFDTPLVYYADETTTPALTSFAIGVEENETYLLCEGNYLIKSGVLSLPTVKTIAVNGADESVFANAPAEFTVVETAKGALLVEFDLQALQGKQHFPYLALHRKQAQATALKIGETETHFLLAEYDQASNAYRTYLALKSACTTLNADRYSTQYPREEQTTGYITSAITLYKFPYLNELLQSGTLARGTAITLLGEVRKLDHEYYHVLFTAENGETTTGYIPQAFVTEFNGLPLESEIIETGATESDFDSVWRLAYLLLGFVAICILTDYLILRKKKGEDDYE